MANKFFNPSSRYNYRKGLLKHWTKQYKQSTREGIVTPSGHLICSVVLLVLFQNKLAFFRKQIQTLECLRLAFLWSLFKASLDFYLPAFDKKGRVLAFCIVCWSRFRTTITTCKFQTIIELGATLVWVFCSMLNAVRPIQGTDEGAGFTEGIYNLEERGT